jgi:hypothetical protein
MTGRCALREHFRYFFHLIKPINTFCAVIQTDSSDGSLQLVVPRVGKSRCEQFIIFTCNIHTHNSSPSTYINSRYKAFYSPIKTYWMRTWVLVYVKSRVQCVNIISTYIKDFSWKKMIQICQILKGFFSKSPVFMIKFQ